LWKERFASIRERSKLTSWSAKVLGGDTIFFPMLGDDEEVECKSIVSTGSSLVMTAPVMVVESSILDHIRELLLQAQRFGCWQPGVGGVGQPPSDRYIASVLQGLPVSSVLNCAIELWRNLEIDDDELLEIAVRDVSYQIQLQKEREEGIGVGLPKSGLRGDRLLPSGSSQSGLQSPNEMLRRRFNPRVDPTVLYLEMKKLTLHLDKFRFCIEKSKRTIFDPVFDGCGSLTVQNVSIKLRVDCVKERIQKMGSYVSVPVLQLRELEVGLEKVMLKMRDTGADWLLNKVVTSFSDNITQIVAANLKEQVREQIDVALQHANSYFEVNPELILSLLGITMDDLEEKVVWV
jgi:hypothetical protein